MGAAFSSKSPLERRNTVARRSQRRSIHSMKPKVEEIFKDIKKFKGITEDEQFSIIKQKIGHLTFDLEKKGKDLQPQVKNIYDTMYKRLSEAEETLKEKLLENQEKAQKKGLEKHDKEEKKGKKETEGDNDVEIHEIHEEIEKTQEENRLSGSTEKRKTVELKFVHIIPDESRPVSPAPNVDYSTSPKEVRFRSPEEKRKSILKVGVPVMPGAMMNEISTRSHRISTQYEEKYEYSHPQLNISDRVHIIIENLQSIEYKINEFVGKKHGKQYNVIRDELNKFLIELNQMETTDDDIVEQIKICKDYVGSCLTFLDEKAIEEVEEKFTSDDEVFENNNYPMVDPESKLAKLLKNTSV